MVTDVLPRVSAARAPDAPTHTAAPKPPHPGFGRRVRLAVIISAVAITVWAIFSPLTALIRVEVTGTELAHPKSILRAAGITPGSPLVSVRLGAIEQRVAELGPVRDVAVTRPDPLSVRIAVTEREPMYVVAVGQRTALVARDGVVMLQEPLAAEAMTRVTFGDGSPLPLPGDTAEGSPLQLVHALVAQADELSWLTVTDINVPARDDVWATLPQGVTVRFGKADEQLANKLRSLRAVLEATVPDSDVVIDVRAPHAPVLRTS